MVQTLRRRALALLASSLLATSGLATSGLAADLRFNLSMQHGDPVLRRDSAGITHRVDSREEAREKAREAIAAFRTEGIHASWVRDLAYDIMAAFEWPGGFFGERLFIEVDGETVWERQFRVTEFPFLRMIQRDAEGVRTGNYYHFSRGWRLKPSDLPIESYVKPTRGFWNIGGLAWGPPDRGATSRGR